MKINNNIKTSTQKIIITFITVLFFASITFIALELSGVTDLIKKPTTIKIERDGTDANVTNLDAKPKPDTNSTPLPDATSSDISLSTKRENNGSLTILTKLTNYGEGTCDLLIKNGNDIYSQSAPIIYQPDYSICEGFNVASDAVPQGVWDITLSVESRNIVNKQTISVEVW